MAHTPILERAQSLGCRRTWETARIVIDNETTGESKARTLLEDFVGRRNLEIYSTARDREWRVEIANEPNANNALEVRYIDPKHTRRDALWAGDGIATYAGHLAADHGLAYGTTLRLLRLRQAADHHNLDGIVTDIQLPTGQVRARVGLPLDLTSAERACWILGLFLRAHNDYTVAIDGNTSTFLPSERFYRAAAVAAVGGRGWLEDAAEAHFGGRPEPVRILGGMITRLARMLRMRDLYAVRLRHWRPDET